MHSAELERSAGENFKICKARLEEQKKKTAAEYEENGSCKKVVNYIAKPTDQKNRSGTMDTLRQTRKKVSKQVTINNVRLFNG